MIDKELTLEILESGEIAIGRAEAESLGLPRHRGRVDVSVEGDRVEAEWQPSRRRLCGEAFADELRLRAQVGMVARFELDGTTVRVSLVERATELLFGALPERDPDVSAKSATGRRRRARDFSLRDKATYSWRNGLGIHWPTMTTFVEQITKGGWDDPEMLRIRREAEAFAASDSFDDLMAPDISKVDPMDHQLAVVRRVLRDMGGRAVLADEVGLGKTIEAGLILKELKVRRRVERALIICPGTLRDQWREELREKFDEEFDVIRASHERVSDGSAQLIMTLEMARRRRDELIALDWDLVIVDEAHKTTGHSAHATRALLAGLARSRYFLMLTATPVQNDLDELYRLVESIRPGTFPTLRDFRRRFVRSGSKRDPKDPAGLRALCRDVMVRWTRSQAGLDDVQRHVTDHPVALSATERRVYDAALAALREGLSGSGDHFRRNYLAQKLVVSPSALALSARRMAMNSTDGREKTLLETIADIGENMRRTDRHAQAAAIVEGWVNDREKGKVIVFTSHTETLDELLAVFADAGMEAAAFHGKVNREEALRRFRGPTPILVSTDAGAEGLNLQFANCVVNYDLPWNPMRIEQRIGRVHRVRQTRDVHVANLYSVGTVDERVYSMLKDKLRMFELLFGQVTTVLGEMGGRDADSSAPFGTRVVRALSAPTESDMDESLERLASELDAAYQATTEQMKAGGHMNSWMVDMGHREGLAPGGATELVPEVVKRSEDRVRQLEQTVRDYLAAVGAVVEHEEDDFISARLPDDLVDEFDSDELHLAFTASGLEAHVDAEFCAPGSVAFDDIVDSLRTRADLMARMPLVDPHAAPVPRHDTRLTLVDRSLLGPVEWATRATWRVRDESSSAGSQLEQVDHGDFDRLARVIEPDIRVGLGDGDPLPASMPAPSDIIEAVRAQLCADLEPVMDQRRDQVAETFEAERRRKVDAYEARLRTYDYSGQDERGQIERALRVELDAEPPDVEVTADLLCLEVLGAGVVFIEDTWRRDDGSVGSAVAVWDPLAPSYTYAGLADGDTEVALCDRGHLVARAELFTCPCCGAAECAGDDGFDPDAACAICGRRVCGACAHDDSADPVCPDCREPLRSPSEDTEFALGWRTAGGARLSVGESWTEITRPSGERLRALRGGKSHLDDRRALLAEQHGLPIGASVIACPSPGIPPSPLTAFWSQVTRDLVWESPKGRPEAATPIPDDLLPALGDGGRLPREKGLGLAMLLTRLRAEAPPPQAPILLASPRVTRRTMRIEDGAVIRESAVVQGHAPQDIEYSQARAELISVDGTPGLYESSLEGAVVEVRRVNRSFSIALQGERAKPIAVVEGDESTLALEAQLAALGQALGMPAGASVLAGCSLLEAPEFASPSKSRCESRNITADVVLAPAVSTARPVGPAEADLLELGTLDRDEGYDRLRPERNARVHAALLDALPPLETLELRRRFIITEQWAGLQDGEGTTSVTYEVYGGDKAIPPRADGDGVLTDFAVDALGHIHDPGHQWMCPACDQMRCRACEAAGVIAECVSCRQDACGECRHREFEEVPQASCAECGAEQCGDCHRSLDVASCLVCGREICTRCRNDESICISCRSFTTGAIVEAHTVVPADLAPAGLSAVVASSASGLVIGLRGERRAEVVVIEDGRVTDWRSGAELEPTQLAVALSLAAVTEHPADGSLSSVAPRSRDVVRYEGIRLRADRQEVVDWTVSNGTTEVGAGRIALGRPSEDALGPRITRVLPGKWRMPSLVSRAEASAMRDALRPGGTMPSKVVLKRHELVDETWLGVQGLALLTGEPTAPDISVVQWRPGVDATVDDWPDGARVIAQADSSGVSCVLIAYGGLLALRMIVGEYVTTHVVVGGQSEMEQARIGVVLSMSGPALVQAVVPVGPTQTMQLVNATRVAHQWECVATGDWSSDTPAMPGPRMRQLITELLGDGPQTPPKFEPWGGPESLREALKDAAVAFGWEPEPLPVALSLHVSERWTRRNANGVGISIDLDYTVHPGGRVVGLGAHSDLLGEASLDDEGHIVVDPTSCPYCNRLACNKCEARVKPCIVCGLEACTPCLDEHDGACTACASLVPHGALKRVFGAKRDGCTQVAAGEDALHTVSVVRDGDLYRAYSNQVAEEYRRLDPGTPGFEQVQRALGR